MFPKGESKKGVEIMMGIFDAVVVNGGRKFRGEAYMVPGEYVSRFGYHGSGVCPYTETTQQKIWNPATGKTEYVNKKYIEYRDVTAEQEAADFAAYANGVIEDTVAWCRANSNGKGEAEILQFAYNVIRKHHREMVAQFESTFGFKEDIGATVRSTLNWAMGLGYRRDKAARIAHRALVKKGIFEKDDGKAAWHSVCEEMGLAKFVA